jgi:hypothetical protein
MSAKPLVLNGIVKDGVIMPEGDARLPDGTRVEIIVPAGELPTELYNELHAWERASDEAWAMIDQWEREAKP